MLVFGCTFPRWTMERVHQVPANAALAQDVRPPRLTALQVLVHLLWLLTELLLLLCDGVQRCCVNIWWSLGSRHESNTTSAGDESLRTLNARDGTVLEGEVNRGSRSSSSQESSWLNLVNHPEDWWDNRRTRLNLRAPDFKPKVTREALWIDNSRTPPWVRSTFKV